MQLHPYIFLGIGSKIWITYTVRDERAEIRRWFGDPESMPLRGASFSVKIKGLGLLGLGDIHMSVSGGTQIWRGMRRAKSITAELGRLADGTDSKPATSMDPRLVLKRAERDRVADFGPISNDLSSVHGGVQELVTPTGTFVSRGDGTVSHKESGLIFTRAPWGMTFDGIAFRGDP